jgi:hypothetical protein
MEINQKKPDFLRNQVLKEDKKYIFILYSNNGQQNN